MPRYMFQFTYTRKAWVALVKDPVDRRVAVEALLEKLGGLGARRPAGRSGSAPVPGRARLALSCPLMSAASIGHGRVVLA